MTVKNQDIRNAAKKAGVKLWQIADELGMWDSTLVKSCVKNCHRKKKRRSAE